MFLYMNVTSYNDDEIDSFFSVCFFILSCGFILPLDFFKKTQEGRVMWCGFQKQVFERAPKYIDSGQYIELDRNYEAV